MFITYSFSVLLTRIRVRLGIGARQWSPAGRATVGRATVGRASVSMSSGAEGFGDGPGGPGGPGGPAGPGGPGGSGPGRGKNSNAKAKRRRRRNIVIASIAAFIMIAGIGMVSGTYYFDQVALPEDLGHGAVDDDLLRRRRHPDGAASATRTARSSRSTEIPLDVQHAVVAAEDNTFYTNDGVDYKGVVRAAWNNVTGGERQGASTISQQYARQWADLEGVTYARKLREAVIALKLNQEFNKDKILEMYLNIVYFGRGAYGIQAASHRVLQQAREGTDAWPRAWSSPASSRTRRAATARAARSTRTSTRTRRTDRFNYIKGQMLELKFVKPEEAETKMAYPAKVITPAEARANAVKTQGGMDKPEGLIVHHVLDEVAALTDPKTGALLYEGVDADGSKNFDKIANGGLKIVTTIDQKLQQAAVQEASRNARVAWINKYPGNLQAALVSVEPGTGAVKAYYGGDSGNGGDFAGYYNDPVLSNGEDSCCGGHPPGSTMKVYTLATGLMNGYRIDSYWNGESPQQFPGEWSNREEPGQERR